MDGWMVGWMDGWLVGWLVDVVAMPTSPSTLVSSLSIHSPFYSPVCPSIPSVHVDIRSPLRLLRARSYYHLWFLGYAESAKPTILSKSSRPSLLLEPLEKLENIQRLRRQRAETVTRPPRFVLSLDALNFLRLAIRPPGPTSKPFTFPALAAKRLVRCTTRNTTTLAATRCETSRRETSACRCFV